MNAIEMENIIDNKEEKKTEISIKKTKTKEEEEKEKKKDRIKNSSKWNKSLIRAEFLKIYMDRMGVDKSVDVAHISDIFKITEGRHSKQSLFAIAKIKKDSKELKIEKEEKEKGTRNIPENCNIFYNPDLADKSYENSLNFIELMFTALYHEKKDYINEDSVMFNFFNKVDEFSKQKKEEESQLTNLEKKENANLLEKSRLYDFDDLFKYDQSLLEEHNKITNDIFEKKLDLINLSEKEDYCLFFIHNGQLVEYISSENIFKYIERESVTKKNFAELLSNELSSKNKPGEVPNYFDDLFIFYEEPNKENDEPLSTNIGEFLIICLYVVLFLVNFFIVLPNNQFYYHRNEIQKHVVQYLHPLNFSEIEDSIVNTFSYFYEQNNTIVLDETTNKTSPYYYKGILQVVSGASINFKLRQTDSDKKRADHYKMNFKDNRDKSFSSNYGSFVLSNDDSIYKNQYQYFLPANSENNVITNLKNILNDIQNNDLLELSFSIMFFDGETDITLIDSIKYKFDALGYIEAKESINGFRAFLNKGTICITLIVINIFFILTMIYDTYRFVNLLINRLYDYFQIHVNSFQATDLLDYGSSCLVIASQIWFYASILWTKKNFPIVFTDSKDYKEWIEYSWQMNAYRKFTAFALFFIIIKFIMAFYNSFPALGVIVDTFRESMKELITYFILMFCAVVILFLGLETTLGGHSFSFYGFGESYLRTFLLLFGIFDYKEDYKPYDSNFLLSPYLWTAFNLIFHLIFCSMFFCVIKRTYKEIRNKKQMSHDAMLEMTKDSIVNFYEKFMNLILFIDPEAKDGKSDKNLFQILKYNVKNLNLDTLFKKSMLNLEEFEEAKRNKFNELRRRKIQDYIIELSNDPNKNYDNIFTAIIFIIHIIIYVLMVYFQYQFSLRNKMETYIEYSLKEKYFSFLSNNSDPYNLHKQLPYKFFEQLSQWNISFDDYKDKYCDDYECPNIDNSVDISVDFLKDTSFSHFKIVGKPFFRTTYRLYDLIKMSDTDEPDQKKEIFYSYTKAKNNFLDFNVLKKNYEKNYDVRDCVKSVECDVPKKGSNYKSFDGMGGMVFEFSNTLSSCCIIDTINDKIVPYLGTINFDFALFSNEYSVGLYVQASLMRNMNYFVKNKFEVFIIPINLYNTKQNFIRIVLEIIHYVFMIYFFCLVWSNVFNILKEKMYFNWKYSSDSEDFKDGNIIEKYYRFSSKPFANDSGIILLLKLIFIPFFIFIYKTLFLLYLFVYSIFEYLFKGIFNLLNLFSVTLMISMFSLWFRIIHVTHKLDLVVYDDYSSPEKSNIELMNNLKILYQRYLYWQSANIFIIFFRFLKYLKFSTSINIIFGVIKDSKMLIIVYIIFLLLVNLGFVLFGYACFSIDIFTFKNVGAGLLNVFLHLSGKITPNEVLDLNNNIWTSIYLTMFFVVNILFLLNFLFSVLTEQFNEMKNRQIQNVGNSCSKGFFGFVDVINKKVHEFLEVCGKYGYELVKAYLVYKKEYGICRMNIKSLDKNAGFCQSLKNKKKIMNTFLYKVDKLIEDSVDLSPKSIKSKCYDSKDDDEIEYEFEQIEFNNSQKMVNLSTSLEKYEESKEDNIRLIILFKIGEFLYGFILNCQIYFNKYLQQSISYWNRLFIYACYILNYQIDTPLYGVPKSKENNAENESKLNNQKNNLKDKEKSISEWKKFFYEEYKNIIHKEKDSYLKACSFDRNNLFKNVNIPLSNYYTDQNLYIDDQIPINDTPNFSKDTHYSHIKGVKLSDLFYIPSVLSKFNNEYNCLIKCEHDCHLKKKEEMDQECKKKQKFYKKTQKFIFDQFVSSFFVPNFEIKDDKDLFIGNFLFQKQMEAARDLDAVKESLKIAKDLPKNLIDQFNEAIEKEIDNTYITLNYCVNEYQINDKLKYDQIFIDTTYYIYLVWDTIYMILFNTFPYKIKKIRNSSYSYKLVKNYYNNNLEASIKNNDDSPSKNGSDKSDNDDNNVDEDDSISIQNDNNNNEEEIMNISQNKNNNDKQTLFFKLYNKVVLKKRFKDLNNKDEISEEKQFYKTLLEKYNLNEKETKPYEVLILLVRNANLSGENSVALTDFSEEDSIYFNNNKFYFDVRNHSDIILKKNLEDYSNIILDAYPKIFKKIWERQHQEILCSLFFGYSKNISFEYNKLNSENPLSLYTSSRIFELKDLDIFEFFNSRNRAELLSLLSPFNNFYLFAQEEILNIMDKTTEEYKNVNIIKSFSDFINYFKKYQTNLVIRHRILNSIFERIFGNIKKAFIDLIININNIYFEFLSEHNSVLNESQRILLSKYYILIESREKYKFWSKFFNDPSNIKSFELKKKKMDDDQDEDKQVIKENIFQEFDSQDNIKNDNLKKRKNDENKFLKCNAFLWFLSLNPFEILNVCQKIRNSELKEFYIELYLYFYGNIVKEDNYLRKKMKINFVEKYQNYLDYVIERETIDENRQKLKNLKTNNTTKEMILEKKEEELKAILKTVRTQKEILENIRKKNENNY